MLIRPCVFCLFSLFFMLFFQPELPAQLSIHPALSGEELLDSLIVNYKPASGLNYGNARDTLYGKIMNRQDSLECIYTGYRIYLPPGQDPTMAAFDAGINTEHAYPRGKGAEEGMARSDMHHLFPSRVNVNADRENLPFGEVPGQEAVSWYYLDQQQSSPPTENPDAYSKLGDTTFEPRTSVKGDIARAMFYFFTMYRMEAELADRDFFPNQKNTLCDWHELDPVDQAEWDRNMRIAAYQDNRPNPYILDCTLAFRAFCPERASTDCGFTGLEDRRADQPFQIGYGAPNPFHSRFTFTYTLHRAARVQLRLTDIFGRPLATPVDARQTQGEYRSSLDTEALPSGVYCLLFTAQAGTDTWYYTQKLVKR